MNRSKYSIMNGFVLFLIILYVRDIFSTPTSTLETKVKHKTYLIIFDHSSYLSTKQKGKEVFEQGLINWGAKMRSLGTYDIP